MTKLLLKYINCLPEVIGVPLAYLIICIFKKSFVALVRSFDKKCYCEVKNEKILIVRLDAIGDFIWNTPFLRELRWNYPHAYITLVVREQLVELVKSCPYVDEIKLYNTNNIGKNSKNDYEKLKSKTKKFCEKLSVDYDMVILPRQVELSRNLESFLIAVNCEAKMIVGRMRYYNNFDKALYKIYKPMFYILNKDDTYKHQVIQILDILKSLGGKIKNDRMELWPCLSDEYLFKQNVCGSVKYYIMVGLKGSEEKRTWDPHLYNCVFKIMQKKYNGEICFLLCGDANSRENALVAGCGLDNCIDLTGKTTLADLVLIGRKIDIYLGSDTGIMHVAVAFSKPVVELSNHIKNGKKDTAGCSEIVGPWRVPNVVLEPKSGLDGCIDECDKLFSHCINQISVEEVVNALERIIDEIDKNNCKLSPTIS